VNAIGFSGSHATLSGHMMAENEQDFLLDAKLVVIADGMQSALRQQLGIASDCSPYDQHALVANLVTELPHHGVAYERFTEQGPIALLPLPAHEQGDQKQHRAALIWTLPDNAVNDVMQLPDAGFLAKVQQRLGNRCGRLSAVGSRHCYPLSLVQAREQVRSRVVLMGSAAHHLHPVAGQGFNLIMRDCLALAETLQSATAIDGDIGDIAVLQQYVAMQRWDQQKTVAASDWLPRIFSNREKAQMTLRATALLGLDFLPGAREWFAREATGL
jgi:ubiquinone biosynthesis UbiH/UbiF/VisC/COQ6 family hydroxylase